MLKQINKERREFQSSIDSRMYTTVQVRELFLRKNNVDNKQGRGVTKRSNPPRSPSDKDTKEIQNK